MKGTNTPKAESVKEGAKKKTGLKKKLGNKKKRVNKARKKRPKAKKEGQRKHAKKHAKKKKTSRRKKEKARARKRKNKSRDNKRKTSKKNKRNRTNKTIKKGKYKSAKAAAVKGEETENKKTKTNDDLMETMDASKDEELEEITEDKYVVEQEPGAEAVQGDEIEMEEIPEIAIETGRTSFGAHSVKEALNKHIPVAEAVRDNFRKEKFGKHHFKDAANKDKSTSGAVREETRVKRKISESDREDELAEKDIKFTNKKFVDGHKIKNQKIPGAQNKNKIKLLPSEAVKLGEGMCIRHSFYI